MKNNLHNVLRQLRKEKNISQEKIAKDLNLSQRAYSNYETGSREPSLDTLISMAEYHNVSLDILLGRYEKRL